MAPFLTNDGVCLLFVEPLLSIFTMEDSTELSPLTTSPRTPSSSSGKKEVLTSADAVYFLLTLACSSNIGSALTYTGNPQVRRVHMHVESILRIIYSYNLYRT